MPPVPGMPQKTGDLPTHPLLVSLALILRQSGDDPASRAGLLVLAKLYFSLHATTRHER